VVDGFGGMHPFAVGGRPRPPIPVGSSYWPGRDRVRGVAIRPDASGGYLIDGYGAMFGFGLGTTARPALSTDAPRWPGWPIARGVAITR
jgi:hypothetical protein